MKHLPWRVRDFHVVGGGCFGSHYVEQLLKARDLGQLIFRQIKIIDRGPPDSPYLKDSQVTWEQVDWEVYLADFLQQNLSSVAARQDHWVPSPLSPHLLFLAFLRASKCAFEIVDLAASFKGGGPEASLSPPVKIPLASKALALSFAKWKCPVHCIEPHFCPGLQADRDWEMERSLPETTQVLVCRHRLQGVGTIAMDSLLEEYGLFLKRLDSPEALFFALATVSGCHGLLGSARVQALDSQAKSDDAKEGEAS